MEVKTHLTKDILGVFEVFLVFERRGSQTEDGFGKVLLCSFREQDPLGRAVSETRDLDRPPAQRTNRGYYSWPRGSNCNDPPKVHFWVSKMAFSGFPVSGLCGGSGGVATIECKHWIWITCEPFLLSGLSKRCFWQTVILPGWHPPFSSFSSIPGLEQQNPLFLWVECNIRTFANFRQNHLFPKTLLRLFFASRGYLNFLGLFLETLQECL